MGLRAERGDGPPMSSGLEVGEGALEGGGSKGNHSLLSAFALHTKRRAVGIQVPHDEPPEVVLADPGAAEELHDRLVGLRLDAKTRLPGTRPIGARRSGRPMNAFDS